VLAPNGDWWWFDTCHMNVADVQILSSSSVSSGTGVYWMFYSGGSYEPVALPAGMAQVRPLVHACLYKKRGMLAGSQAGTHLKSGWKLGQSGWPCPTSAAGSVQAACCSTLCPTQLLPSPHSTCMPLAAPFGHPAGQPGRGGRRPRGLAPAPRPCHVPGWPQLGSH
jgi:hypothetical protein